MPIATILPPVFIENGEVCLAVAVSEAEGRVEYIGRVPIKIIQGASDNATRKALLVAACKATRDASLRIPEISPFQTTGTVEI